MPERNTEYYQPTTGIQRYNLSEGSPYPEDKNTITLEQPNGLLDISFYGNHSLKPFPNFIGPKPGEKILVLISSGEGNITKNGKEFQVQDNPAVFFLEGEEAIATRGNFSGWIARLTESQPTQGLPTNQSQSGLSEKVYTRNELTGEIDSSVTHLYPDGKGEIIRWVLGQWNSKSPLNVAYEGGGLGSVGDQMHKEPGVAEIHLISQGRIIHNILDENGNLVRFPGRTGDVVVIEGGTFCQVSRYSGDYKGFCIKWAIEPGGTIDPKAKFFWKNS